MRDLHLNDCPPLGPLCDDEEPLELPRDWNGDPFTLLPSVYNLTPEEAELAERYRNNDISGGYIRSQIAAFRAPKRKQQHDDRRRVLKQLQALVFNTGYILPESFVRLLGNDHFVDRIRHNNIWLDPVPLLIGLPAIDGCKAVQFTSEGQGCCYFSLLLDDDGDHVVLFHEHEIADSYPPPATISDRLSNVSFLVCSRDFNNWLGHYFLDCRRHDEGYADSLRRYPGM